MHLSKALRPSIEFPSWGSGGRRDCSGSSAFLDLEGISRWRVSSGLIPWLDTATEDGGKSTQLRGGELPVCAVMRLSILSPFLHLITSVCMHVCMCGVHACVCMLTVCVFKCTWGLTPGVILIYSSTLFFESGSLNQTQSSPLRLGSLASLLGGTPFPLSWAGIKGWLLHSPHVYVGSGNLNS